VPLIDRSVVERREVGFVELAPVIEHGLWAIALVVVVPVAGKIIVTAIAVRGAKPTEKPAIIRAVAELFRWRRQ
jgi:Kef-type K+ transport system membrane component KefB